MLAVDPQSRGVYVLRSERSLPESQRHKFSARFLTCREHAAHRRKLAEAMAQNDDESVMNAVAGSMKGVLVSVSGPRLTLAEPADPVALLDVLTMPELLELAYGIGAINAVDEIDVKN